MIYFDVRPSAHLPTLELRICDSCPRLEDVVLLAGLFRALVIAATAAAIEGQPLVPVRPELLQAATWRAARAGLEGDLVDPLTASPVPACRLIGQLLADLRPALESTGDWELVSELTRSALARGSSAARQRAARASGGLRHVVDTLVAETRATDHGCRTPGCLRDRRGGPMNHPHVTEEQVRRADELVSWTCCERIRFLWYWLRLTVREIVYANGRMMEWEMGLIDLRRDSSQGRAVKRNGFEVSAPTGQMSIILPDSSDSTVFPTKATISACSLRPIMPSSMMPAISWPKRTQRVH